MVRFRLKKSLPFDLEQARISYHAQTGKGTQVVAAVVLKSVLEEYESAFRDAGYSPGVVMPSMLAALGAADAERPTLVVKVDARTIGIAILDQDHLLLIRTLENTRGVTITGDQLAEEVYPSVVFFQDTYNLNIERVYVSGLGRDERGGCGSEEPVGRDGRGTGDGLADRIDDRNGPTLADGGRSGSADFVERLLAIGFVPSVRS